MKKYIKPSLEVVKSDIEAALMAGSLPKGQEPVNPEDALAPAFGGNLLDDSDLNPDFQTEE